MEEIWIIKGKEKRYTDAKLVELIKRGLLTGNDYIATKELNRWVKIADSIYEFYLKGE